MLNVGFAETDITPKIGSTSPGAFQKRVLNEIHDPLKAVAMVLQNDATTLAIVGIDALFVTSSIVARARRTIEQKTKIPGDRVLIGASHTHGGGPVAPTLGSDDDPAYVALVADRVAEAVEQAFRSLHPAEIDHGFGHEPSVSFNRRFLMRDGRQVTHPGLRNPEAVHPAGPIDPDVGVLAARAPGGELLGVFVNFACHATVVGGPGFSADYIHYLRENLRRHYGRPHLPVGFLIGSAGDVTQVDNMRPGRQFGEQWADMIGMALAAEVAQAVARMEWKSTASLRAVRTTVPIAVRDDRDGPFESPVIGLGSGKEVDKIYERERALLAKERAEKPVLDCEVQAFAINDLGIVTNGAEFFCQLGLDIKAAGPFPAIWISSLTNEWIGYVGTANAFYAGGYEPRTARSAKMAPNAGQLLVEASLAALKKVRS